jgi:hypothetical protein
MSREQGAVAVLLLSSVALHGGRCWLTHSKQRKTGTTQRWGGSIADFFYFVGLPYFAIVFGLLSAQKLGLKGLEYFSLMRLSPPVSAVSFLSEVWRATTLMALAWLPDLSWFIFPGLLVLLIWSGTLTSLAHAEAVKLPAKLTGRDFLYYGLHWAFYWGIFWLLTGDPFFGVLLGTGLAAAELKVEQIFLPGQNGRLIVTMLTLILMAMTFYYSANLWLVWLMQIIMIWLAQRISHKLDPLPTFVQPNAT